MIPGLKLKKDVHWNDRHGDPDIWVVPMAFWLTAPPLHGDVMVLTSLNDSEHGGADRKSAHYRNEGGDIRSNPNEYDPDRVGYIIAQNERLRIMAALSWIERARAKLDELTGGNAKNYYLAFEDDHIHWQLRKELTKWRG